MGKGKTKAQKKSVDQRQDKAIAELKRLAKPSYGYIEVLSSANVGTAAAIRNLAPIIEGTAAASRLGDKVGIVSIKINLSFLLADTTNICRYIIFIDKTPSGVMPTQNEILQDTTTLPHLSTPNVVFKGRFGLLRDETLSLSDTGEKTVTRSFYRKFKKPLIARYSAAASTIPISNGLFILLISDSSVIVHPLIDFSSMVKFLP